jgi:hypothetical protein
MGIAEKVVKGADALWDDGWPGKQKASRTNFYIRKLRKKDCKSLSNKGLFFSPAGVKSGPPLPERNSFG